MIRVLWRLWYVVTNCECHHHVEYGWVVHAGCRIHDTRLAALIRRLK